ncbi:uncharacterized protein LOC114269210 [Camellia sinensis]|uniref:uncharacterized protein LOC114269210 n=1 Tax=Camellia sinensis TaxID=4442 RepID=UPI001035DA15|nr:uncharacterized protein LOC114269210 [Camellia sinensis]
MIVDTANVENIPVVNEFLDVFPNDLLGDLIDRKIEFIIDVVYSDASYKGLECVRATDSDCQSKDQKAKGNKEIPLVKVDWKNHRGTYATYETEEDMMKRYPNLFPLDLTFFLTEDVKVVALSNALQNLKLASPDIQKDIVNVAAFETITMIIKDLGDAHFSILIDEARDMSIKEQMAVVIRYVNKKGQVIECFLGIEHVANTNALSLKQAVENLHSRLGLSISIFRGQGYNGASNIQGELNGLETLILKENPCAYYVHCFAHQLEKQVAKVAETLNTGELSSGKA